MRLYNILLSAIAIGALSSCSALYEDLEPCPQGVDLNLTFTRNMDGVDAYAERVHCTKLLIYGTDGRFYGDYDVDGANASLDLPVGDYTLIAYGGMACEDAAFDFSHTFTADSHHYSELETFIKGTRAPESSRQLHSQFHGMTTLTVDVDDMNHRKATIDLTHNINYVRVMLSYSDASQVNLNDFEVYITADNAVCDHSNRVKAQGEDLIYRPYTDGVIADGKTVGGQPAPNTWADFSIGRLTTDGNATLHIVRKSDGAEVCKADLVTYFSKIKADDASNVAGLQDYLDRQDQWTMEYTLDPETEMLFGLTIKINGWTIILNQFDL